MYHSPVESQIAFRKSIVLDGAGKATAKSKYWYNVQKDDTLGSLNLEEVVEWKRSSCNKLWWLHWSKTSKSSRTWQLEHHKVYEEVHNEGQRFVTTTWVVTKKHREGIKVTKACFVARGFKEDDWGMLPEHGIYVLKKNS